MSPSNSCPRGDCQCGALMQQSWWQEALERQDYQVVRVDSVNSVADVVTILVDSEPESRHPFFLTVADIDWPALLANFAEPIVTRNGTDAAAIVHDMLVAKLHQMLTLNRDPAPSGRP
jgi:hypothetical protein